MRFSEFEYQLLSIIQTDALYSIPTVAKQLGVREHRVRRAVARFARTRMITRKLLVNHFQIGFTEVAIYFSYQSSKHSSKSSIRNFLRAMPNVIMFVELLGKFDFAIVLCVKHETEVEQFFDTIAVKCAGILTDKSVHIRTRWYYFGNKYVSPGVDQFVPIKILPRKELHELDPLSVAILRELSDEQAFSISEISKRLKVPHSTIDYRIKKLRKDEIICGLLCSLDVEMLGYESFRILIQVGFPGEKFRRRFLEWCHFHLYVVSMVMGFGTWDFELRIEVKSNQKAKDFCDELIDTFMEEIKKIELLPISKIHTIARFCAP